MMIIMPCFAHREETSNINIVALYGCAFDFPISGSHVVREIANQPMTCQLNRDAHANSPNHPGPAAEQIKQDRPWNLLKHPCFLHELVYPVFHHLFFWDKLRRIIKCQVAMELPPAIFEESTTVF